MSSLARTLSSDFAYCVHLSEHCTLCEEQRFPGIHQDQIKVGLPGPVRGARLGWMETHKHEYKDKTMMYIYI